MRTLSWLLFQEGGGRTRPSTLGANNEGSVCYYCMKVFDARYKRQLKLNITSFEAWLGVSWDRKQTFDHYLQGAVAFLTSLGDPDGRVPWARFDQKGKKELLVTNQEKLEMIDPEDNPMDYTDYVAKHGDP